MHQDGTHHPGLSAGAAAESQCNSSRVQRARPHAGQLSLSALPGSPNFAIASLNPSRIRFKIYPFYPGHGLRLSKHQYHVFRGKETDPLRRCRLHPASTLRCFPEPCRPLNGARRGLDPRHKLQEMYVNCIRPDFRRCPPYMGERWLLCGHLCIRELAC